MHARRPAHPLWRHFPLKTGHWWLNILLPAVPAAIVLHYMGAPPLVTFALAALAIVPLAGVLGEATDAVAGYSGPVYGGLINATMGNATELIIAFFALRAGHVEVVKASLSGSIIGNLLLVLGVSIVVGGYNRDHQKFSRTGASTNSTMMFIAAAALIMPAVYDLSLYGTLHHQGEAVQNLSLWTSGILIVVYLVSFIFVLRTHRSLFNAMTDEGEKPEMSMREALIGMVAATLAIAWLSEILVGEIEAVTQSMHMTELFVGVIVVAIVGNAAEHSTAIVAAKNNKMDLAMTIAVGSSTQIALFVAPVLVLLSMVVGKPMSLVFNGFEIAAIVLSVLIVEMISADGETNWFEGAQLLAVYLILAVSFYFVPAS